MLLNIKTMFVILRMKLACYNIQLSVYRFRICSFSYFEADAYIFHVSSVYVSPWKAQRPWALCLHCVTEQMAVLGTWQLGLHWSVAGEGRHISSSLSVSEWELRVFFHRPSFGQISVNSTNIYLYIYRYMTKYKYRNTICFYI